jgi:predicted ATPase/DNA-binding SARP family transcriptional activator
VAFDILVLGPVRATSGGGQEVAPASGRQLTLLAALAARRDRVVSVDELVDALWGDDLPERPTAALQSQVFRLRRLLADPACLSTEGAGYRLRLPAERLDAGGFERLVADARRHRDDPERAIGVYDDALALWRGSAYAEVADHDAVRADVLRLEELRVAATQERASLLLTVRRPDDAAAAMEQLTVSQPFREEPVAIHMRALAAMGRHAEAVQAFAEFRRSLAEELGLEPSPELAALEADILRHETSRRPTIGLPGNSFVGREVDLATVVAALSSARLVTLTGPGGVGKTRLALHAAARAADQYHDGVCLVELADIDTGDAVAAAAATAVGVYDAPALDRIVEFLRTRTSLLVVDNCEHVLEGARALVSAVLTRTPDVNVLATGRTRLGVEGERVVSVAPLPMPEWDDPTAPAVALFVDRADAVRPGFIASEPDMATVAELCRRLAGIPLAIELAAARTMTRTPAEILANIDDDAGRLADRHRSTSRHRSLAAVLEWSNSLLAPIERQVLTHVAVFSGGFTTDAASAVTSDVSADAVLDALTELVEHSLLSAVDAGGVTRFTILEPIREHAERRLADSGRLEALRRRHATWFARWIDTADAGLRGSNETTFARAIAHELPNLRAAHRWSLDNDIAVAAQIVAALYWYAFWYGATEACEWALAVIEREPPPHPAIAGAHATAALGAWRRGEHERARALAARGIDLAGDDPAARFSWEARSSTAVVLGDYDEALACHATARELALRAGDITQAARETAARALTLGYAMRVDDARTELENARTLAGSAANPTIDAFCEYVRGEVQLETAPRDALPLLSRARDDARRLGNRYLAAIAGTSVVSCAARIGEPIDALADYAELLDYFDRTGSVTQQWTVVRSLIETLTKLDRLDTAAVLLGALDVSTTAAPLIGTDAQRITQLRAALGRRLGKRNFEEAAAHGATLGDEQAFVLARRHTTHPNDRRPPS